MFLPEHLGVELTKVPLLYYFYLIFLGVLKKFTISKALKFSSDHLSFFGLSD